MRFSVTTFLLSAVAALSAVAEAGPLEVNAPQLTQCKNGYLSWAGKYSPFNVTIINQKNGAYLKSFGLISGSNYTWTVDLPAQSNVALKVIDAKGNINYSNGVWIKNSSDSSCVSATVDHPANATVSQDGLATVTGNSTSGPGVSSGGIAPGAAATTGAKDKTNSGSRTVAGLGLLLACSALTLVV